MGNNRNFATILGIYLYKILINQRKLNLKFQGALKTYLYRASRYGVDSFQSFSETI